MAVKRPTNGWEILDSEINRYYKFKKSLERVVEIAAAHPEWAEQEPLLKADLQFIEENPLPPEPKLSPERSNDRDKEWAELVEAIEIRNQQYSNIAPHMEAVAKLAATKAEWIEQVPELKGHLEVIEEVMRSRHHPSQ